MKLSKKIAIMFVATSLLTLILYLILTWGIANYSYNGNIAIVREMTSVNMTKENIGLFILISLALNIFSVIFMRKIIVTRVKKNQ